MFLLRRVEASESPTLLSHFGRKVLPHLTKMFPELFPFVSQNEPSEARNANLFIYNLL
jgi:hypothetical protein